MNGKRQNILVTGAGGFIGKNLVDYLIENHGKEFNLFYPFHSELELLDNERVRDFIVKNKIDIIIHCASKGGTRKAAYDADSTDIVHKNLKMFFNLAGPFHSKTRLIFLGSGAEYDYRYYKPGMSENYFGEHVPQDAYGFSKYACSRYIENRKNMVNLCLFGVFGKYEDYELRFISNAILKNLFGFSITIVQNVLFDYLYINDLLKIIYYFIVHKAKYRFYNVCTGKVIDLVTIAEEINKIADKPSEIIIKHPGLNSEYSGSNARLLREIKLYKFTPFEKALKQLYIWYKDNLDKFDRLAVEKDEYCRNCRVKT